MFFCRTNVSYKFVKEKNCEQFELNKSEGKFWPDLRDSSNKFKFVCKMILAQMEKSLTSATNSF